MPNRTARWRVLTTGVCMYVVWVCVWVCVWGGH